MKLDEFVKQSLLDITNGVVQAQRKTLLYIAPGFIEGKKITEAQYVKFDVVVTVSKEGGGGIKIFSIGDAKLEGRMENTNRLTFEVPIYFNAPTERNPRHHSRQSKKSEKSEA